jgi:virulence factor Mce-like protein
VRLVNKQAPSMGRILAIAAFTLSCFGVLLFLWLTFGGSVPLKAQGYRFEVAVPEAPTLAVEADVRIAGVNVGKVKTKELDESGTRTLVEVEVDEPYAPIPEDTKVILRQKTLLGENYLELTPGSKDAPDLADGGRLDDSRVESTVELDEIFSALDKPTRDAFQEWTRELAKAVRDDGVDPAEALNDAFGNLAGFAVDGAELLRVLDEQEGAVKQLVKNTGATFGALNEQEGALHDLIVNADRTFDATAARDRELAQTIRIFPTFLDESKATVERVQEFSTETRPVVNDLKAPADDLAPTVRSLGDLAPDLKRLFQDLGPLINASEDGLPALTDTTEALGPFLESAHPFFQQLNPILSYFNFHQRTIAGFITNGGADLVGTWGTGRRGQTQIGILADPKNFEAFFERPEFERGNAYLQPNALQRAIALGGFESFDCNPSGGEVPNAQDAEGVPPPLKSSQQAPPCLIAPPSLYDGKKFNFIDEGEVRTGVEAPQFREGNSPAVDPNPDDPEN